MINFFECSLGNNGSMDRPHLYLRDYQKSRISILVLSACIFIFLSTKGFPKNEGGSHAQQEDFVKYSHYLSKEPLDDDVDDVWKTPPPDYAKRELTKSLTLEHKRKMAFFHVSFNN